MTLDLHAALDRIIAEAEAVKAALLPPAPEVRQVRAGESLQAALDQGGAIALEAGATWAGTFTLRSGTRLAGHGATLEGQTGSALLIPPGTFDVTVDDVICRAGAGVSDVIQIGENTARQTTVEAAPHDVTLMRVRVLQHRGKRAFGVHGRAISLLGCEALDVWDPSGQDSQAVYVGNAPGDVLISGGRYSAGSEVILVGGDTPRIPGLVPQRITVEDTELFRPLTWQTDGVKRKVKNLLELKTGEHVTVRRSQLHGSWQDGQDGWAIVLTPTLDGAVTSPPKPSGTVRHVTIEDCDIRDVGSIVQMQGRDYSSITEHALTDVVIQRNVLIADRVRFGAWGQLARIGAEPGEVSFHSNVALCNGSSTIYYYRGSVLTSAGTRVPGGSLGTLRMNGNVLQVGQYGLNLDGLPNAREWQRSVGMLGCTNNVFGGPTTMQAALPGNGFFALAEFLAREDVAAALSGPVLL